MRSSIRFYWRAFAAVALALGVLRVAAAPVADSFATSGSGSYTAPAVLNGQNPGIPGFSGAWSGSTKFSAITTGLTSSAVTYAKGGAAELVGTSSDAAQNVSRSVTVPSSSTYYMSFMVIRGNVNTITPGSYALIGFGNGVQPNTATTNSTVQGLYVGFVQTASTTDSGGTNYNDYGSLIIRTRQDIGGTEENVDTILVDGEGNSTDEVNYFVVAKVTVNTSGSNDTLQYWVNPTSISSDSAMSSSALVTNTITVNTIGSSSDLSKLMLAEQSYDVTADFDEPRIATNLTDLAAATPTPEPSTVGLVLLAAGILGRRRK